MHVTVGILMLLSLVGMSIREPPAGRPAFPVEMVGLYWHFVDIVWIVIFTVVYLIPTPSAGRWRWPVRSTTVQEELGARHADPERRSAHTEHPSPKEYIRIG